jgi:hypothetical protein
VFGPEKIPATEAWLRLPSEVRSEVVAAARRHQPYSERWVRQAALRWAQAVSDETTFRSQARAFVIWILPFEVIPFNVVLTGGLMLFLHHPLAAIQPAGFAASLAVTAMVKLSRAARDRRTAEAIIRVCASTAETA